MLFFQSISRHKTNYVIVMYKLLSQQDGIRYLSTQNKGSLSRTSNIQKNPFQYTHNDFRYALTLTHLGRVEI